MSILAFDLGAGSGRAILGRLENGRMQVEEIHRFPNDPVQVGPRLHWDILRLFHEIKSGILKAVRAGETIESMAIDSWAVDFGLLDRNGELIGDPYHYRDRQTDGVMEQLQQEWGAAKLFRTTGIQFLPFNTIYQLAALKRRNPSLVERAETLLMIPDLLRYFLTGEQKMEFTNASTTQLLNPITGDWEQPLLDYIGIPKSWFPEILQPGSKAGALREEITEELGIDPFPVYTVGEHDTASAVVAVPAQQEHFAYLSCGTWSLMGTEVKSPVLTDQALHMNFTNEGGVNGTFRLLKNIMGLWLLQECRSKWAKQGNPYAWSELVEMAEQEKAPFRSVIDPDDERFLNPLDMVRAIQVYCREHDQPIPESEGQIVRCILESLALKYRYVLGCTEDLSGQIFSELHMVGGGIQNELLCQWTANAIDRPVFAGPAEGSGIGNLAVQWMAMGKLSDLAEARQVIKQSFPLKVYQPQPSQEAGWDRAYDRLLELID